MDNKIAEKLIASNLLIATYLREILNQKKINQKISIKEQINKTIDDFNATIKAASD